MARVAGRPILAIVNGDGDEELEELLSGHLLFSTSQQDAVPALKTFILGVSGAHPKAPPPLPEGLEWGKNMEELVKTVFKN